LDDDDTTICGPFEIAGSANAEVALEQGNPTCDPLYPYGHTPTGQYRVSGLVTTGQNTPFRVTEFGPFGAIVLEPRSGVAALAQETGRSTLMIHGGNLSRKGHLRVTNGCLRLSNDDMRLLTRALQDLEGVVCEVNEVDVVPDARPVAVDGGRREADPPMALTREGLVPVGRPAVKPSRRTIVTATMKAAVLAPVAYLMVGKTRTAQAQGGMTDYCTGLPSPVLSLSKTSLSVGGTATLAITNYVEAAENITLSASPGGSVKFSKNPVPVPKASSNRTLRTCIGGTAHVTVTAEKPGSFTITGKPGSGSGDSVSGTIQSPVPHIASVSPASVDVSASGHKFTITGTGFSPGSVVRFETPGGSFSSTNIVTTYVSPTSLTAHVPGADLGTAGSAKIEVSNPSPGGGVSNAVVITIKNLAPVLTSISPSTVTAGTAFTLTIKGTGFAKGATVTIGSTSFASTFVSSTEITVAVSATALKSTGKLAVEATNPAPNLGVSNKEELTIGYPLPTTTTLSPASIAVGSPTTNFTVTGKNFVSGSGVLVDGKALPANDIVSITSTSIVFTLKSSRLATAATLTVAVENPAPGGGTSTPALSLPVVGKPTLALAVGGKNVGGLTCYIDADGVMPALVATVKGGAVTPSTSVTWKTTVVYTPTDDTKHGYPHTYTVTLQTTANGDTLNVNWGSNIIGGQCTVTASFSVGGQSFEVQGVTTIGGTNPTNAAVNSAIQAAWQSWLTANSQFQGAPYNYGATNTVLEQLGWWLGEGAYLQFKAGDGTPRWSTTGDYGVGMFQVVRPTGTVPQIGDIWSWQSNISSAVQIFGALMVSAASYPANVAKSALFLKQVAAYNTANKLNPPVTIGVPALSTGDFMDNPSDFERSVLRSYDVETLKASVPTYITGQLGEYTLATSNNIDATGLADPNIINGILTVTSSSTGLMARWVQVDPAKRHLLAGDQTFVTDVLGETPGT
jgi:hypothetical protein